MPRISEVVAYPLELQLKEAFETAKGRKTASPTVIIELRLENGVIGYGSATPLKYVTGEDTTTVLSAIKISKPDLEGADVRQYLNIFKILAEVLPDEHTARAGLEIAILDAFCKVFNLSMFHFFGGVLEEVQTDVTIPICPPDEARFAAERAASQGFRCLKIKVGVEDPEEDFERVIAIHQGAPQCDIRIDANQGFVPTIAVSFVTKLQGAGVPISLLEQPVDKSDIAGLRYVTQHTSIPVFADEAVVTPFDALRLLEQEAIDGINIKVMKSGISGALAIIALCQAARKEIMLGSMLEPGIGLATSVHFACGTGAFHALDLDAYMLVADQPFIGGFTAEADVLRAHTTALGHGSLPASAQNSG